MYSAFYILLAFISGLILGYFLFRRPRWGGFEERNRNRREEVERRKVRILKLVATRGEVASRDIQALLSVSDPTATRYLEELERDGKIVQEGKTGRGTVYALSHPS